MVRFRTLLLATLVLPVPLAAQEVPQVVPTPRATSTPAPLASPTPAAPIVLPTPTPTVRVVATPDATSTPRAVAAPVTRLTPASSGRPIPRPTSTPAPTASPSPLPVPAIEPSPTATVAPPPVIASPLPTTDERTAGDAPAWPWMLGAGALLVAGIGLWLARRQRTPDDEEIGVPADADEPEAIVPRPPAVPPTSPAAPPVVARVTLRFRPTRVGFNMLSATVEGELTVANQGQVPLDHLRVRTALLGAHAGQDVDLAAFLAEPIGRPAVPPFALAPGEERTVRILAAAPRATLRTMTAAGRPMFVPVLAVDVRVAETQVAQAFAIGAERVDSAKLAPFWLDVPDRAYTEVAARPHGPAVTRRG